MNPQTVIKLYKAGFPVRKFDPKDPLPNGTILIGHITDSGEKMMLYYPTVEELVKEIVKFNYIAQDLADLWLKLSR
jgi:hypothetical protein